MRRRRRRPVYYTVTSMDDGTVLAAFPVRKPAARVMKRDGHRLDEDNVCQDFMGRYVGSFKSDDPGRFRFFDVMANRLNVRRAIRELVRPELEDIRAELSTMNNRVRELMTLLCERSTS